MLGYDLKMARAKFQGNRFRIAREIDEKQALQIYQNNCDPRYRHRNIIDIIMCAQFTVLSGSTASSTPTEIPFPFLSCTYRRLGAKGSYLPL